MRFALLLLLLPAACAGVRVVDRADDGTPILLCGGQPDVDRLKELHARHGIRTVVSLRGERPEASWWRNEKAGVEAIGATWIHLPVSSHEAVPPETRGAFFDLVEDRANWPLYVHCESGIHRAGLVCGLYRMQYQGWTAERAIAEMRKNGFDLRGDRPAAKAFLRGYRPDPGRAIDRRPRTP